MTPYYDQDGITIYHGDCREVMPHLGLFDLLLTDPPYGISLANHGRRDGSRSDRSWSIENDESQTVGQVLLDSWDGAAVVFASPMKPWSGEWRQFLVWEKGEHVSGGGDPATCWKPNWELIQVRGNGPLAGRRDGSVLRFMADKNDYRRHPTPKPVSLLRYLIGKLSPSSVIDPFLGSGSTLLAAFLEGVRAVGIELEEKYCEIAANRLRQKVLF